MRSDRIDPAAFLAFLEQSPYGTFVQTPANTARLARAGWRTELVGLWRKTALVGVAALIAWKTPFGYEYECLQGPVLDYSDTTLVTEAALELRNYVKQQGGLSLRLQPPVVLATGVDHQHMQDDPQGEAAIQAILRAGFRLVPTRLTDSGDKFQRWFYTKALAPGVNAEELLASYNAKTRRGVRSALKYGVEVVEVTDPDELGEFAQLMVATGDRRQFNGRDEAFYRQFFELFERPQARFWLARVDAVRLRADTQTELTEIDKRLRQATDDAKRRKLQDQRAGLERRLAALPADAAYVSLASGIFMFIGHDVVYFLGGSDKTYGFLNAPYLLQHYALTQAAAQGARQYDFYGTNGTFNGKDDQEGVYQFKLGFQGQLEQRAACYEAVLQPVRHRMVRWLRMLRSWLR